MNKRIDRIFGLHAVKQILENAPETILSASIQESIQSESVSSCRELLNNLGVSIQTVPRVALSRMVKNQNHQGILLEVQKKTKKTEHDLDDILVQNQDANPLYLILDSIQDPHNLGACIRTADAVGVTAVIIPNDRAANINETVRKVASGAVENVVVINVVNLVRAIKKIKESGVWVVGTTGDAEQSIYALDLKIPTAIVMGGEGKGMRDSVQKECDYVASLPINGQVESLNVSVAAGVVLYEVIRQRSI
ncbi:23S rRNA (guanosine(2251)-2'-O)-methyltransferase RlmB [Gammaproteobacteria bacterium]|jgi:23S rRNA (guanosine2251-2'-O)-methyltransferase|nr:23S rRNA (guanosine(2251)-2'-O)-methyltransferase RlmB [Gammaproteobacteria bacterium]|tara:strand:- start:346 stop:1095 length:750 start_codon:yes stop_codon:yes gene_type:complete